MLTGEPFIPETITVHLGKPDSEAENITVSFPEYVKNVASSEIYPTWPENALRANIYVIVSYVLNRIYTEWYRSRGYYFDVTNSTQYDQAFVYGREIFENISDLVDELFTYYIRREDAVEPMFAAFCDGISVSCAGLSQWGTVELANEGKTPYEILKYYYGDHIVLEKAKDIRTATPTYPGAVLRDGEVGRDVQTIQTQLNRISGNFQCRSNFINICDFKSFFRFRSFRRLMESTASSSRMRYGRSRKFLISHRPERWTKVHGTSFPISIPASSILRIFSRRV